jgi:hypothetical protein
VLKRETNTPGIKYSIDHNNINKVFETSKDGLVLHYDFEKFLRF